MRMLLETFFERNVKLKKEKEEKEKAEKEERVKKI